MDISNKTPPTKTSPFPIEPSTHISLNDIISPFCLRVLTILNTSKHTTCLVGGCVRDILQNKQHKDVDLATTFPPLEAMERLQHHHIHVVATGLKHGTISAFYHGEMIEITTLRSDTKSWGRKADVSFHTSFQEDASRRDFTFNALYVDLDGNVFDFFDGIQHLQQNLVTFIGDPEQRIQEDYLRILRYIRFFTEYDRRPHPPEIIIKALEKQKTNLSQLSKERIRDELLRILSLPSPQKGVHLLYTQGLFPFLIPHASLSDEIIQKFICWIQYKKNTSYGEIPLSILRLAFLLQEHTSLDPIQQDLALSRKTTTQLKDLLQFKHFSGMTMTRFYNFLYNYPIEILYGMFDLYQLNDKDQTTLTSYKEILEKNKTYLPFKKHPPITGKDLLQQGIKPGKKLGDIQKKIIKSWIKSGFTMTKEQCLEKAQEIKKQK